MIKPLELYIGLRYTRAKRRNHFISFISLVSMFGVALGVMVLITVISVMNGFEKEMHERILGMASHATIQGDRRGLANWPAVAGLAEQHQQVEGVAPYVHAEGMLSFYDQVNGTVIRGVQPERERQVSEVGEKMIAGRLEDLVAGEFGIILGKDLARILGVMIGDKVTMVVPQANITPTGLMPRLKRFTVVGVFEVGMYEYDSALALIHINDAQRLFRLENNVSGVRLKLTDMFQARTVTRELVEAIPGEYWVSDWTREHANLFRAVKMEKTVMFFILLLLVAIAAFNLLATLVMAVVDKEADIAILRTLGASPGTIMGIFIVQGALVGFAGIVLGVILGVALATNVESIVPAIEQAFGVDFLSADIYYISELPSDMHWNDVWTISGVAMILCLLFTIYPARRAAKVQPAEALRYE